MTLTQQQAEIANEKLAAVAEAFLPKSGVPAQYVAKVSYSRCVAYWHALGLVNGHCAAKTVDVL